VVDKEEERDFEELFDIIIKNEDNRIYLKDSYLRATTRHELWFLLPAFCLPVLLKEVRKLNENIEKVLEREKTEPPKRIRR
jgi:hypothetical protein